MIFERVFAKIQVLKSSVGEDSEPATGRKLARHYGTASDDGESRRVILSKSSPGAAVAADCPCPGPVGSNPTPSHQPHSGHLITPSPLEVCDLSNPLPP